MSAGLLWPVVMRKSERLSVLCVQSSLRHSCFEKCVSISHFANLLSFAFLKNHLKRADKPFLRIRGLLCKFWCFHHRLLIRYFKVRIKSGGWKRTYCESGVKNHQQTLIRQPQILAGISRVQWVFNVGRCLTEGEAPVIIFFFKPMASWSNLTDLIFS